MRVRFRFLWGLGSQLMRSRARGGDQESYFRWSGGPRGVAFDGAASDEALPRQPRFPLVSPSLARYRLVADLVRREELFYQLGLRQFGGFTRIKLKPAPPLRDLVRLAVEHEEGKSEARMSSEEIIEVRLAFFVRGG